MTDVELSNSNGLGLSRLEEVCDFLAFLWAFVLETPDVPRDISFFELGGRSLHMMLVINHLRSHFGIEVSPLAFSLAPTINALARQCCEPQEVEEFL